MKVSILLIILLLEWPYSDGLCTFPSDFQNSVWTSTNFGTMTFTTTNVTVTKALEINDSPSPYQLSWECFLSESSKLILRTTTVDDSIGTPVVGYYCLLYTKQNSDSYYYESNKDWFVSILVGSHIVGFSTRWLKYSYSYSYLSGTPLESAALVFNTTSFSFSSPQCQSANDPSTLNVMIKDPASAKQVCAEPILGSFVHETAACKNGTWTSACDTDKSNLNITYQTSTCSPEVYIGYSAEGFMYCALASNSSNTYYQILYNPGATSGTDTRDFSCLTITVTNTSSDGNTTTTIEQRTCDDRDSPSVTTITLTSDVLCPVIIVPTTTIATEPEDNTTPVILAAIFGSLAFLLVLGAIIGLCIYCNRDPNKGKPIVENTKPRFEDPDLEDTIEDLEMMDNASSPVTRDDITIDALSPTNIMARRPNIVANGNVVNAAPDGKEDWLNTSVNERKEDWLQTSITKKQEELLNNGGIANGYYGREMGNHFHEKPGDRPAPRIHKLTPGKESMVIFNGDEKVISGNDSRVIPNEYPTARSMSLRLDTNGASTYKSMDEMSPGHDHLNDAPYPSVPREKSNLMPPIETIDTPKEKK